MSKIKSWVVMIGDVVGITGPQVMLQTKNVANNGETYTDTHPVLVSDEKILEKVKIGKKLGFTGIVRRIGNRTKLVLDPQHWSVNQSKLKGYRNQAGIEGPVVFKSYFGDDASKRPMMTIGIGELGTTGTAIYGSIWRDMATHWNSLLHGKDAIVRLVGYMRSRVMTGANAGQIMYELVANREKSAIVDARPIATGFESYDDSAAQALMALEFEVPEDKEATGNPEDNLGDHLPGAENDDIPF
jgi:hypothetical protein